ncbi:MAG: ABC transporter permease [Synergistaceae bacterium]|nr:ABC transporter permease [Synergistaceae bacterium]MBP9626620.1 ABC transporter permease [Synergistaceae bacterium]MBP9957983.1 ABC transporter permease [Synergistaceae bacterium]
MWKYALKRMLMLIPVLVGVALIIFSLLYITPGDPARLVLGEQVSEEAIKAFRDKQGLNDPFLVQFTNYVYKAVRHGDIGYSYVTKNPVINDVVAAFPSTVKLAFLAVLVAMVIGVPLGIISAVKQYSILDSVAMLFAMVGISMPSFWLGLLLILFFSVELGWFPSSGFDTPSAMVLPAFALGLQSMALITRMTRSSMLEVIRQDYIRTARSKGQLEKVIIWRHALGNALIPIITVIGLQFGNILGGAVLTESIFSIPGIGRLMVDAIKMRDYPVVQGGVLFIAVSFSIVNLCVDLAYAWVDPRIKTQYKG